MWHNRTQSFLLNHIVDLSLSTRMPKSSYKSRILRVKSVKLAPYNLTIQVKLANIYVRKFKMLVYTFYLYIISY